MRTHEIEEWALRVIEAVLSKANVEDARVELKRQLVDPDRSARRIAGHANRAAGEPILWIVGIDEKTHEIISVTDDTAAWWSSVQSRFDGIAPTLTDVTLSIEGKTLKALLFDTDRRPFVVRTSTGEFEVPWRDGTRVRSATRNELIRLLTPVARLPDFKILSGSLAIQEIQSGASPLFELKLNMHVYVVPKNEARLVFPFHQASCTLEVTGARISIPRIVFNEVISPQAGGLRVADPQATVKASATELVVTGPGSFHFLASYATGSQDIAAAVSHADRAIITATILPTDSSVSAILEVPFRQIEATGRDLVALRYP